MGALALNIDNLGYFILLYGVGILAMAFSVMAFQLKHRVAIVLSSFLGQAFWVLYFLLQSDFTSAVACGLNAVMFAIFAKKDKWKWAASAWCVWLFEIIICAFSIVTFASWLDVFPLLAGVFGIIANSRSSEKRIRQFSLLWCSFWLINSALKIYPVAFINDFLCTGSALLSLIRYRNKEK